MSNREMELRPPYNDHFEKVKISEKDKIIDAKTQALFCEELIRPPRWNIDKNGVVQITKTGDIIDGLHNEEISPELARAIEGSKMVEELLPDYMIKGSQLVRPNTGLSMLNIQWGREELNHGIILGIILEKTGHKTKAQISRERQENLERIWELPFPTIRQVVAHAAFQEMGTYLAYRALESRAKKDNAPKIAKILKLIADDEIYHWSGYRKVTGIYHEIDPEGTIEDVLHVARNFRMPAENLHPNGSQWVRDLISVGVLSNRKQKRAGETVVYPTLVGFRFIPKDVARKTADEFLKKTNSKYQTARDARQV